MVDFGTLRGRERKAAPIEPRTLYGLLPKKELGRGNLWDVQAQVLTAWWDRREERDLVVKVNTGGGKTTTGLVILQSVLNAGEGPALYVAPDKYLVNQVLREAAALGLATTTDPDSSAYLRGEAIGVVNAYKLVNGRSVFSENRPTKPAAPIGTVVVDDAHAAIATTRAQLSLELESTNSGYKELLTLFEDTLKASAPDAYLDVKDGIRGAPVRVPFWTWRERLDDVRTILRAQAKDDLPLFFSFPAVRGSLALCHAVFAHDRVNISAPCPPIAHISALRDARHRIFLTATLADDSVLVTDFGADAASVRKPITPITAGDIGERMILAPEEINPSIQPSDIRAEIVKLSKTHNTVVIVPSDGWAAPWREHAAAIATADEVGDVVERLTSGKHVGLVVLISKYDGIDLPQDACRVLVIDGLPQAFSPEERLQSQLRGNEAGIDDRQIQRIEQGMGRGIRSNEDHCVVFLIGPRLAQLTVDPRTVGRFSAATRAQLELSRDVAAQVDGQPLSKIIQAANQALDRDPEWVLVAKDALADLPPSETLFSERAIAERAAFEAAHGGNLQQAARFIHEAAEGETDGRVSGALLEVEATYVDAFDPERAQQLLAIARTKNPYVTRPLSGVVYTRLAAAPQAEAAAQYLTATFTSPAALRLHVESIIERLIFDPEHTQEFEEALFEAGLLIGLGSQRPEQDLGSGPDNLWALGNNVYWVIEAKSGATSKGIGKRDMAQLGQSLLWFGDRYDAGATSIPVMVHPSTLAYSDASPHVGMRVITPRALGEMRVAFRGFAEGLAAAGWTNSADVARLLEGHNLRAADLKDTYTVAQNGVVKS